MTKKIDEILSESIGLNEAAKEQISNLWESKISEAREEVAAVLREEFARKFEHDKGVLVESIDRFLTDKIRAELEEFAQDRQQLIAERVSYKGKIVEHTKMLESFLSDALVREVKELRADKKAMKENFTKLENFLLHQLAEEIREFHTDKKELVEQKVKVIAEGKRKLQETKTAFIKRAAKIVESNIEKTLHLEMSQFKQDIKEARQNEFGRKIFESVAAEFMTSHLNEGTELRKMTKVLEQKEKEIAKLTESVERSNIITEAVNTKLKATQDLFERQKVMNELLAPLSKDKKSVMKELLESVGTKDLQAKFTKYLPSVLNESMARRSEVKSQLNESSFTTNTGNRARGAQSDSLNDETELNRIRSLAGINK